MSDPKITIRVEGSGLPAGGADGQVLSQQNGKPVWVKPPKSEDSLPLAGGTLKGDLNIGSTSEPSDAQLRIAKRGADGKGYQMASYISGGNAARMDYIASGAIANFMQMNAKETGFGKPVRVSSGGTGVTSLEELKTKLAISEVPSGATAHQQLVTDADGVAKWEDRLAYSDKIVIEWDGVVGDRVTNTGAIEGSFVKVSDLTPQLSDVVGGTALYRVNRNGVLLGEALIKVGNAVYSGDDAWICACIDENGQGVSGGYLVCALVDGANGMLDGQTLVFPEAGVYVVHIVAPSENVEMLIAKLEYGNVKPLDKAFIPPLSYAPYVEWQSAVMSVAVTKPLTAGTILNWVKGIKLVYGVEEDCFYAYEFSDNARYKYTISDGKWVESLREFVE